MIIVDTDILIWILRGKVDILDSFKQKVQTDNKVMFITPVQIAEIFAGIRDNERIITEKFLKSFNIINIDENIGKLAGKYMNKYGKSYNVTLSDSMIASCVFLNDMKLWTLNKKHYPMLDDDSFETS